jgi:D-serine deaminase-like pyridoxal phosphate-dependent protein
MNTIDNLSTPALILDLDKLDANIASMASKANSLGVRLRPHVKTHKCVEIAMRQKEAGCNGITVSTLHEAAVFADHGFDDITWAFPVNLSRLDEACELARRCTLRLVVDSEEAVTGLENMQIPLRVWLKVDCGYHRAGIDPEERLGLDLAQRIRESSNLIFDGILTHSGHAYKATGFDGLKRVAEQERSVMVAFANRLRRRGIEVPAISIGSTPAMSATESLAGIDEARPGNYVFYDATQVGLGSCQISDCAVTVVASVVSAPRSHTHSVVDAGALAMSKDPGLSDSTPLEMGQIFDDYGSGLLSSTKRLYGLSQEHGLVTGNLPIGSRLRILPNHSCLTVACFDEFVVSRGDDVVDKWKIWRGR